MKSHLGLVVASLLSLTLNVSAQAGGTQNPFGASGAGSTDSASNQNPFGGGGGGTASTDSANNQNPFGGSGGTGSADSAGSQNPFGSGGGSGSGSGSGSTDSAGSQNPFGSGGGGGTGSTNSGGSQNPFFGGGTNPSGGSNPPRLDQGGCPTTRAVAPSGQALSYASSPICPTGDGKLYQSPDGATFFIQCCTHGAQTVIKTIVAADFGECMDECSKTDRCSSVQFVTNNALPSEPYHTCKLSEDGGYSSVACGSNDVHSYAFVVDPPAIDSPDSAGILCSTECPFANGQLYVSAVGESFHMDCGQRHGTQVIYRDRQPSLKTCMEACGRLLACHSVDYDIHRQICYYGKHQGEPTIDAPGFVSAHSMGCAGACAACSGGRCPTDPDPSAPPPDNRPFPQDGALADATPPESLCPRLNGQILDAGGARYLMTCGSATGCPLDDGTAYFGATADQTRTLDGCLEACAATPGCNSINFLDTDFKPNSSARCILRSCNPTPTITGNHLSGHKL